MSEETSERDRDAVMIGLEAIQSVGFNPRTGEMDIFGASALVGHISAQPIVVRLTKEAANGLIGAIKAALDDGLVAQGRGKGRVLQ